MYFVQLIRIVLVACVVVEVTGWGSEENGNMHQPFCTCSTPLMTLLVDSLFDLTRTVQVAFRGFLLGFGATLLKDLLVDAKRGEEDRIAAFQYGRSVGFGMACFLVGASLFIPASWRYGAMTF